MVRAIAAASLIAVLAVAGCVSPKPPPPPPPAPPPLPAYASLPPPAPSAIRPEMFETPAEAERETRHELRLDKPADRQFHRTAKKQFGRYYHGAYCGHDMEYRQPVVVRTRNGMWTKHPARCIPKHKK